ncbi:unnamed protein product, partial [Mesorhabditis belari]|uniref:Uncharacterized protein n=1 Tax=Mesorhabditis belari TaxID=2138241 RepID=A0AAF3JAX7_9BILA
MLSRIVYKLANRETELRADRVKRATCLQWNGGDACRKKCQGMVSSCTGKRYTTGHCEMSWTVATCICKPYCAV